MRKRKSRVCWLPVLALMASCVALSFAGEDTPQVRPDSHAPIDVMGDHAHKQGELMLSYRLMHMVMNGLLDDTTRVETTTVLKDFMMAPTTMTMQSHMFGAMFAPHNRVTLMAMTSYLCNFMEMEAAHIHTHGGHDHPVGHHEMSSAGIGDVKAETLVTLFHTPALNMLLNGGISLPTGSIEKNNSTEATILPYPMQLGSGSFELHPGLTVLGYHRDTWSYGGQIRGKFRLNENARGYRLGPSVSATAWGAYRLAAWLSVSGRFSLSHWENIAGSDPELNVNRSPTHRPDLRAGTRVDVTVGCNAMVPNGVLAGQRIAVELRMPVYQNLAGPQLKTDWGVVLGWQYAFRLW